MSQYEVTLLLGSNLGDTRGNLERALEMIKKEIGPVVAQSPFLYSEPVEFASNNIFCNIAVLIKSDFSPIKLLNSIKKIEVEMGRLVDSSVTETYADRVIDIDIVLFGQVIFKCKRLQIPHIRHLHDRDFSMRLLQSLKH
ncbi:2-amino-4-hydroxy-6-hydroxymethyldihydropteridine diphosphokinase [Kaistella palustris]|uniref:2-amino-4-hydroxy-6- hydroxymethyldihydropteridine diphosphokinase n=1 Tax=Kaistella palustris TaxID=493376 RepID=UPI00040C525A|nr:2-amino-4-hydroxy-6-hydroxymethyldihydropteridine diphosphokinase [Kaistella palustris]